MNDKNDNASDGDLRVWWIPQVPMRAFYVPVNSVDDAILVLNTLADYDLFQYENNVKPDYTNAGGLEQYQEPYDEWCEWYDDDGNDIDDLMRGDVE